MNLENQQEEELDRKIRRQNRMIIVLGIIAFLIVAVVSYVYREIRVPMPPLPW